MTSEFDIIRAVVRKALEWQEDSERVGNFMPDPDGDKIARIRTASCAREILRIVGGTEAYGQVQP